MHRQYETGIEIKPVGLASHAAAFCLQPGVVCIGAWSQLRQASLTLSLCGRSTNTLLRSWRLWNGSPLHSVSIRFARKGEHSTGLRYPGTSRGV